jgi:molybdopterin-guanine dinucleotide biosynthesis adapter protein
MLTITIIGQKNTGKTSFITEFVPWLRRQGYTVGTIKHTPHPHALDVEGKDSYRHRKSGAARSALITPEGAAVFQESTDKEQTTEFVLSQFSDVDILVVEGNLGLGGPKFEIFNYNTEGRTPYAAQDRSIIAVISLHDLKLSCPIVSPNDFETVLNIAREPIL